MPDANNRDSTAPDGSLGDTAPGSVWTTREPGTYLLLLHLSEQARCDVGRLGAVTFQPGWYIYVGSALGGLGARLRRHARVQKTRHWHIDALREIAQLVQVTVTVSRERIECTIAAQVAAQPGASQPIARFGASDCRCRTHLFHFAERPDLQLDGTWSIVAVDQDVPPIVSARSPRDPA